MVNTPALHEDIVRALLTHVEEDINRASLDAFEIARSRMLSAMNPSGKQSLDAYYQSGQVTEDLCCKLAQEIVPIVASSYYASQHSHYTRQAVDLQDIEQFLYEKVLNRYLANIRKNPTLYLVSQFRKSFYTACQRECMGHYRMFIKNHGRGTLRTRLVHIDADNGSGPSIQLVASPSENSGDISNSVVNTLLRGREEREVTVWKCPVLASAIIESDRRVKIAHNIGECGPLVVGDISPVLKKVMEAIGIEVITITASFIERVTNVVNMAADGCGKSEIRKAVGADLAEFAELWECAREYVMSMGRSKGTRHIVSDTAGLDAYKSFCSSRSLSDVS